MSKENVEVAPRPPLVRLVVWIAWSSTPVRALALRWLPRGRIRQALITGWFVLLYEHINRDRAVPTRLLHSDFALRFPSDVGGLAGVGTMHGPQAISQMFAGLEDGFRNIRWVPEQVFEAPDGRFLALVRMEATGGGSGVPLRQPVAIIATFEEGKISRGDMYGNRAEAFEAAGLKG